MLQATDLTYAHRAGDVLTFPDLHCQTGEHWLLLGASGSGKTTYLQLLAGMLTPRSGSIRLGDTRLDQLSGAKLDRFRGRNIGMVFQRSHFVAALTVRENLMLAQSLAGVPEDEKRLVGYLQQLGIGDKLNRLPHQLSQGEQQRVAIARALVNDPLLLLADEPTSALDDHNAEEVIRLLQLSARNTKATLLIVTHDKRLENRLPHVLRLHPAHRAHQNTNPGSRAQ